MIVAIASLGTACGEVQDERYATFTDARAAGAIERGWLPEFVPSSARDLRDVHDLDTNAQTLTFTVPPSDIPRMVETLQKAPRQEVPLVEKLLSEVGWETGPADDQVAAYQVCGSAETAALLVDSRTGAAAYKSPVEWTTLRCPRVSSPS